jgi:hypothetical protein
LPHPKYAKGVGGAGDNQRFKRIDPAEFRHKPKPGDNTSGPGNHHGYKEHPKKLFFEGKIMYRKGVTAHGTEQEYHRRIANSNNGTIKKGPGHIYRLDHTLEVGGNISAKPHDWGIGENFIGGKGGHDKHHIKGHYHDKGQNKQNHIKGNLLPNPEFQT